MLTVLHGLPEGLLERDARRLHEVLAGPTLIHLEGRRREPLLVSALLHGNEPVGWEALRALLERHRGAELPRALSVFLGNVQAARAGRRHLDGQPDYNRVWRGESTPEHAMTRQVVEEMRARSVFASVDIHNNTGLNPHYACVNRLEPAHLHLATVFSRTVVYFRTPDSVQSRAFSSLCPAVTVECGQPDQAFGVSHALEFIEACLHLSEFPKHPVVPADVDLFHTVAVVKLAAGCRFGFAAGEVDVQLVDDLDHLNFRELPAGTVFGWVRDGGRECLEVRDEAGVEVGERYFAVRGGELVNARPVMPSMLTRDTRVIRQDCLCYLMERYVEPLPGADP